MKHTKFSSKRLLLGLLILLGLVGALFTAYSQTQLRGDANGDGIVNILDCLAIARYAAGLHPTPFNPAMADADCDGMIIILDALLIARYTANLIPAPACVSTATPTSTPTPTCSPCVDYVEGYVRDMLTALPVAGVSVTMQTLDYGGSITASTDANGYYRIIANTCRSSEHVRIHAAKAGYDPFLLETTLACSRTNTVDISLVPEGPTATPAPTPTPTLPCIACDMVITGKVTRADDGSPIAGASIVSYSGSLLATTDANGDYAYTIHGFKPDGVSCPQGDFFLKARAPGFVEFMGSIIGFKCGNYTWNVILNLES
jgi:hypothetical protein